ncbi:MAG: phosphoribosylanthranilate isomerase [Candidatus Gastranaerophilales bacterium]|nr:phosphoribosylanthranilate isomerase [Candidatus Gastranaerophilales bacterium]
MVKIKICGITRLQDGFYAAELGADLIGFIFYPKSPRYIQPETAGRISGELKSFRNIRTVGVFVNETPEIINEIIDIASLDYVQLHGEETPETCKKVKCPYIKNIRTLDDIIRYNDAEIYLTDAPDKHEWGGTGKTADWDFAKQIKSEGVKLMLSGGINADNAISAVNYINPDYIDISSSIEQTKGIKDYNLMKNFFDKINEKGEIKQ